MAALNNGNVLMCEHWGSTCREFGSDGTQIVHSYNINSQFIDMSDQTRDGLVYATTSHGQNPDSSGIFLKELDIENGTTRILLDYTLPHGWEAVHMSIGLYGNDTNEDVGMFLTTPNPIGGIYHLSNVGLKYIRENFDKDSFASVARLLYRKVDDEYLFTQIATNIPQDTWTLAAGINDAGRPYIVQSTNWGPLLFYEKPEID